MKYKRMIIGMSTPISNNDNKYDKNDDRNDIN